MLQNMLHPWVLTIGILNFHNRLSCSVLTVFYLTYKLINDSLTFLAYAEVVQATLTSRACLRYEMRYNGSKRAWNTQ
jgi:hypothetical protein